MVEEQPSCWEVRLSPLTSSAFYSQEVGSEVEAPAGPVCSGRPFRASTDKLVTPLKAHLLPRVPRP